MLRVKVIWTAPYGEKRNEFFFTVVSVPGGYSVWA